MPFVFELSVVAETVSNLFPRHTTVGLLWLPRIRISQSQRAIRLAQSQPFIFQ